MYLPYSSSYNAFAFQTEAEEDKHLDGRHAIEEAMSTFRQFMHVFTPMILLFFTPARALMRNCPKCQKGMSDSFPSFLSGRVNVV